MRQWFQNFRSWWRGRPPYDRTFIIAVICAVLDGPTNLVMVLGIMAVIQCLEHLAGVDDGCC